MLYIESEIVQSINYSDVISSFAEKKIRRVILEGSKLQIEKKYTCRNHSCTPIFHS